MKHASSARSGLDRTVLFTQLLVPAERERLVTLFKLEWLAYVGIWKRERRVLLDKAAREILCRAACAWAGILLSEHEVYERSRELGAVGGNRRARRRRARAERWLAGTIKRVRSGKLRPPAGSAAHVIAWQPSADGELLSAGVATELLHELLSFIVTGADAIPVIALALHEQPRARAAVRRNSTDRARQFVERLRANTAYAARFTSWLDVRAQPGRHEWRIAARGPGQALALELLESGAELLASVMEYEVSRYDLRRVLEFAGPGLVLWEVTPVAEPPDLETPQEGQLRPD